VGNGGRAGDDLPLRHVPDDACLSGDHHAIPDLEVIGQPRLPPHDDVGAEPGAAGDPGLSWLAMGLSYGIGSPLHSATATTRFLLPPFCDSLGQTKWLPQLEEGQQAGPVTWRVAGAWVVP